MPYANDGMSTVEIEVFGAFIVPDVATFTLDDVDVEERIYWKKIHLLYAKVFSKKIRTLQA